MDQMEDIEMADVNVITNIFKRFIKVVLKFETSLAYLGFRVQHST